MEAPNLIPLPKLRKGMVLEMQTQWQTQRRDALAIGKAKRNQRIAKRSLQRASSRRSQSQGLREVQVCLRGTPIRSLHSVATGMPKVSQGHLKLDSDIEILWQNDRIPQPDAQQTGWCPIRRDPSGSPDSNPKAQQPRQNATSEDPDDYLPFEAYREAAQRWLRETRRVQSCEAVGGSAIQQGF